MIIHDTTVVTYDITLIAHNKPVAMQPNPAYGATVRTDTITTTNAESVAMQSNPAYGTMIEDNQNQRLYFN